MFQSRLRLAGALLAAGCAALVSASLGAGQASAGTCPEPTGSAAFELGITNTCNHGTTLTGSADTLYVESSAPGAVAFEGVATATTGAGWGVKGGTNSSGSLTSGVFGILASISPGTSSAGVYGESVSQSGNGYGVLGQHVSGTGSAPGVYGETNSTSANATGVTGTVLSTAPGAGATAVRGINSGTNANGYGVWGSQAGGGTGVLGQSSSGIGVLGYSDFVGLLGYAPAGGYAGYFAGDAVVSGTLYKGAGAFRIDHPLDPAHKYLQHSFVESPHMMNVYNGNVTTDSKGFATVKLPAYFQALNRSFRYQLTVIDRAHWTARAAVWTKIQGNRFTIRTDQAHVQVSWQVTGVRHDAYANAHRIPVVLEKSAKEQGKYLHPELYGKPRSESVVRLPAQALGQARR